MKIILGLKKGFFSPFQAVKIIFTTPSILIFVLIPLLINLALYFFLMKYGNFWLKNLSQNLLEDFQTKAPEWAQIFKPIAEFGLKILSWLILLILTALSFTIVSSLIAAPFNEFLSDKTQKTLLKNYKNKQEHINKKNLTITHNKEDFLNLETQQKITFIQSIKLEIKRTLFITLGSIFTIILGLFPLMQIPAIILGALLLSFEYIGITLNQHNPSLKSNIFFIIRHLPTSLGFGLILLILMAIPFASIIYVPLAVVSGAFVYTETKYKI